MEFHGVSGDALFPIEKKGCEVSKPLVIICTLALTAITGVAVMIYAVSDTLSLTLGAHLQNRIALKIDPIEASVDTSIAEIGFDRLQRNGVMFIAGATSTLTSTILLAVYACYRKGSPRGRYFLTS